MTTIPVRFAVCSPDGDVREELREIEVTTDGDLRFPPIAVRPGDRVYWITALPGVFGGFTVQPMA